MLLKKLLAGPAQRRPSPRLIVRILARTDRRQPGDPGPLPHRRLGRQGPGPAPSRSPALRFGVAPSLRQVAKAGGRAGRGPARLRRASGSGALHRRQSLVGPPAGPADAEGLRGPALPRRLGPAQRASPSPRSRSSPPAPTTPSGSPTPPEGLPPRSRPRSARTGVAATPAGRDRRPEALHALRLLSGGTIRALAPPPPGKLSGVIGAAPPRRLDV